MNDFEIILEGVFGPQITLDGFMESLSEANGRGLLVKMSSSGGNVEVATSIKNAIENYARVNNARVTFDVIGWVQSAASYTMMIEGAKRIVHTDSLWMHHNPENNSYGDHKSLANQADIMSKLTDTYATAYANISGRPEADIRAEMDKTTYLVGQEIVDAGFADELKSSNGISAAASGKNGLVEIARQDIKKVTQALQAAALGGELELPVLKKPEPQEPPKMEDKQKEKNAEQVAGIRAGAFAAAMSAMPERNEQLLKAFQAGKSADYFEGQAALAADMKAASDAKAEAAKAKADLDAAAKPADKGGDAIGPVMTGDVPMETKNEPTYGETGETVEV